MSGPTSVCPLCGWVCKHQLNYCPRDGSALLHQNMPEKTYQEQIQKVINDGWQWHKSKYNVEDGSHWKPKK